MIGCCGRCGGPRRCPFRLARGQALLWFSLRTSCLAAPSASVEGAPWGPSRDYFPDEIADERVADGVDEWRRCVAELEVKNKKRKRWVDGGTVNRVPPASDPPASDPSPLRPLLWREIAAAFSTKFR